MVNLNFDTRLRQSAMDHLGDVLLRTGGGPVRSDDVNDFVFEDQQINLMDLRKGIWKPRQLDAALSFRKSIRVSEPEPYADSIGEDGLFRYKWQGSDLEAPANRGMRTAMERRSPLIMFYGVAKAIYQPIFPVYVVGEEQAFQQFVGALDDVSVDHWNRRDTIDPAITRRYSIRMTKVRVHQPVFRSAVLEAYERRCALCNLGHVELLDAAHIRPDSEGGEPVVNNGIAMCKIHHASYDHAIMGIRPDHEIRVRPDVLAERDGPTLKYSLQGLHGEQMHLPRRRAAHPKTELLEERWERFLAAC